MGKLSPARACACKVLAQQRTRNARARDLLRSSPEVAALDPRDRGLCSRLVLGVVSTRGALDALLDARVAKLRPRVRDALRLAAYELLYADVAPHVAVSQGVELASQADRGARGMANAVLRRLEREELPRLRALRARAVEGACDVNGLADAYGLPAWLVARVAADRGLAQAHDYARASLGPAPVWVRANTLRPDAERVPDLLRAQGLDPQPEELPYVWRLDHAAGLAGSGLVEDVTLVVADLAAQRVARLVAPAPGSLLLEVGQGRGTKTLLLQMEALAAGGLARIVGVDSVAYKTKVAASRLARDAGDAVRCLCYDARKLGERALPLELDQAFDQVFVDAPCSGSGTLRRHPEIAWDLDPAAVEAGAAEGLVTLQAEILAASAARVAVGGRLDYATCSVLRAEDEDVVDAFLASAAGAGFEREEPDWLRMPAPGACDGHFLARLRRTR